jgi:hypothetical protein
VINVVTLGDGHRLKVFESRVLRDEATADWRKLHNELRDLYCVPGTIRVIEWWWVEKVARMGEESNTLGGFRWGNLTEGDNFEDLGEEGRLKLKWILKKQNGTERIGLIWHRIWASGRNLANTGINSRDSENAKHLTSVALSASQAGLLRD